MTIEEINQIACQIIAFAGDGKSTALEAISLAEESDFREAQKLLKESEDSIRKAHEIHTKLLVEEARDPGSVVGTMMLIHASNHLSVAEITQELAGRFVSVYEKSQK
jgi:cellobiose-specific phosphotransferase system component IIA